MNNLSLNIYEFLPEQERGKIVCPKILSLHFFILLQKNSAIAGAVTGVAVALTSDESSHEHIVQYAITGAAMSTAANIFAGIF